MQFNLGCPLIAPAGSSTGVSEYSQAIELRNGDNAVLIVVTGINFNGATNVGWQLQSSNDLAVWVNEGTGGTASVIGTPGSSKLTGISSQFVRLRYWGTGAAAIVGITITTNKL